MSLDKSEIIAIRLTDGKSQIKIFPYLVNRVPLVEEVKVSGKTGTAQVVKMKATEDIDKEEKIPYQFRDHAWFVAFAPYEKPEVAISVLVEHGGHGGAAAAPIAKKLFEKYFELYRLLNR